MEMKIDSKVFSEGKKKNVFHRALFLMLLIVSKILGLILLLVPLGVTSFLLDASIRTFYYNLKYLSVGLPFFLLVFGFYVCPLIPAFILLQVGLSKRLKVMVSIFIIAVLGVAFIVAINQRRTEQIREHEFYKKIDGLKSASPEYLVTEVGRAAFPQKSSMSKEQKEYMNFVLNELSSRNLPNNDDVFLHVYEQIPELSDSSIAIKMSALSKIEKGKRKLILEDLILNSKSPAMRQSAVSNYSNEFKDKAIPILLQQIIAEQNPEVVRRIVYGLNVYTSKEALIENRVGDSLIQIIERW